MKKVPHILQPWGVSTVSKESKLKILNSLTDRMALIQPYGYRPRRQI